MGVQLCYVNDSHEFYRDLKSTCQSANVGQNLFGRFADPSSGTRIFVYIPRVSIVLSASSGTNDQDRIARSGALAASVTLPSIQRFTPDRP